MDWNSHALLGKIAARSLPDREKALLDFAPSGNELRRFPPCRNGADQLAASCLLMDWVYEPEFHVYGLQKDGKQLTHTLPDSDGRGAFFSGNTPDPGKFAEILTDLMDQTLQAWCRKDYLEFTRRGGILGHFLQDVTAPTHTISGGMLRTLFPDPVQGRLKTLGSLCYQIDGSVEISAPDFLGPSIPHAVFYLTQNAFAAAEQARKLIPELIHAVYNENQSECMKLLRGPVADAAKMTADAWHTIFCIAAGKISHASPELPLHLLRPLYHHPDVYAYSGPDVFCRDQKSFPLTVIAKNGAQTFAHGFGMKGYSGMKFFLNGIFDHLDFALGLADMPSSGDPHVNIRFTIETAPGWNNIFSEDMEYGTKEIFRHQIGPGESVQHFSVDISGAGTLVLAAKAKPYSDEQGNTQFAVPDIAVLNPVLHFK